jgi:Cu(I)/Ag(I) efflux system membrane fusion protein
MPLHDALRGLAGIGWRSSGGKVSWQGPAAKNIIWAFKIALVRLRFVGLMVVVALAVGYWDTLALRVERLVQPQLAFDKAIEDDEYYCPMHRSVVSTHPDNCPICGMPLSHRKSGKPDDPADGALARVQLSPERVHLAGIKTVAVERRPIEKTIETFGTIQYDQLHLLPIASQLKGRVARLFVNTVGQPVRKGDPLVWIFSQDFYEASHEVVLAKPVGGPGFEALKQRLQLLGAPDEQVEQIVESGRAEPQVEIVAPMDGTVVEKKILATDYVMEGTPMFAIADLSNVWAVAKVFEDDVAFMRAGEAVVLHAAGYPGQVFEGRVSFVAPELEADTRTLAVRIDVPNPERLLKSGMYVTAELHISIGSKGTPEPGGHASQHPLVIPTATVIDTGSHHVVYKAIADGVFDAIAVQLGPRSGDYYPVIDGLSVGDRLVAHGAFLIDAEARLNSRISNPTKP